MDFFSVVILSIVEGITEFLPVSSTGHLILASDLLKIPQSEFVKTFEIFIQKLYSNIGILYQYTTDTIPCGFSIKIRQCNIRAAVSICLNWKQQPSRCSHIGGIDVVG